MDENDVDVIRAKIIKKAWKSTFQLFVLVIYLLFGATLFHFIEYETRQNTIEEAAEELEENRAELLKVLWGSTIAKNENDWTIIANERLDLYEHELKGYIAKHIDINHPYDTQNPWHYTGSFFYSFTVVTTIGYGHIAPETDAGKIATIFYGIIGIPLTLIVLAEIGKCLTLFLKYWAKKSQQASMDSSEEFNFGPLTACTLTFIYLFTGAALFSLVEEWDLLDSSYFSFVTFSTIGFGDMVPEHEEYLFVTVVYVFSALSLVSMCFCSIQEFVDPYMNVLHDRLTKLRYGKEKNDDADETSSDQYGRYSSSKSATAYKSSSPKVQHKIWTKKVDEDDDEEEESVVD